MPIPVFKKNGQMSGNPNRVPGAAVAAKALAQPSNNAPVAMELEKLRSTASLPEQSSSSLASIVTVPTALSKRGPGKHNSALIRYQPYLPRRAPFGFPFPAGPAPFPWVAIPGPIRSFSALNLSRDSKSPSPSPEPESPRPPATPPNTPVNTSDDEEAAEASASPRLKSFAELKNAHPDPLRSQPSMNFTSFKSEVNQAFCKIDGIEGKMLGRNSKIEDHHPITTTVTELNDPEDDVSVRSEHTDSIRTIVNDDGNQDKPADESTDVSNRDKSMNWAPHPIAATDTTLAGSNLRFNEPAPRPESPSLMPKRTALRALFCF
ncbi:hypothetical protein GQ43DRAFT_464491 [Delitschia confertaspora ATCC 74209]|uniref:Uncharacterized protein n=1 Tax=Delitschia confertaspora ATCC 74209 TaxID=1513339 RepID=A0A9P4JKH6_9PLEO|nr:hypothetical protein GQ43DRAFT_464491 [Delitschia confertaspora ATCC 74209]